MKLLLKFIILTFALIILAISYLSFLGIETDRFDEVIKKNANTINKNIKLEFNKTKIRINLLERNIIVKLKNPQLLIKKNPINLSKLDLFLSLKSFVNSDFLLERTEIAFFKNNIKDLTKISSIFLPRIINKQLEKVFEEGSLEGEFIIPFDKNGSIAKNYSFYGKISNASIKINKNYHLKNLTTTFNSKNNKDKKEINFNVNKGKIYNLDLTGSLIDLISEKKIIKVKSLLKTKGEISYNEIKKIFSLFNITVNDFKNINGSVDLSTNIDFFINKKFRIQNLSYSVDGIIPFTEIFVKEKKIIKTYLPEYNDKLIFENLKVKFINSKTEFISELNGFLKIKDKLDSFKLIQKYNYKKKLFDIDAKVNLTNSQISIPSLNYKKESGKDSEINLNTNFSLKKFYNIDKLNFLANKTEIKLFNLNLNKNFEVNDFNTIKIITFSSKKINNDFFIRKNKKITIMGKIFDAEPLLKSLYKKNDRKTFSKNFSSELKINFEKVITGTNDTVSNFSMISFVNKGSYDKLILKGNFSDDELIEMSIYQVDKNKKTLQVISDRARPFIKNFDFIKGFEGGKLEYESTISEGDTSSNLIITNFKVSKIPALAQLLTLASLRGIADTLSGEGVRFDSFEMKSNNKDNVINIEDALAFGPAVSILLDGYVDKGKTVSLSGTLVPATKLNSIIASIPLIGDILVGKKTGEGVIGVSFKMKGPPKNIKTTVNPIKTLTPRFIVRAIENLKKKKKNETK